jgi:hypothetical protein
VPRFAGSAPAPVLLFHRLRPLRIVHVHAADLRLAATECHRTDSMLPAQLCRFRLMPHKYPNDLLFRVPALLHRLPSRLDYERTQAWICKDFREQVNVDCKPHPHIAILKKCKI